jgi:hypothetical protein
MTAGEIYTRLRSAWAAIRGWGTQTPEAIAYGSRAAVWSMNRAMYDGSVYEPNRNPCYRDQILRTYCGVKDGRGRIIGHFNPARGIVDAQQNVLRGTWGKDIRPVLPDDGSDKGEQPVAPDLADSLKTIWRDSNFDTGKTRAIYLAALFGTVGLRVSRIPDSDRVVVQSDDPSRIFNVEEDSTGNVTSIVLKYKLPHNFGTMESPDIHEVDVVEIINKEEFSKIVNKEQQFPSDDRKNMLGFCPYVLMRHRDNGTVFGDWCFRGLEPQIHDINWRITQQGRSINRTQFANWLFTAGGPKPTNIDVDGETSAMFVQTVAGTPPPSAEAIVAKIDQAAAMEFTDSLRQMLRDLAPVLAVNDLKLLAGQSGETIAQILKPAEAAILDVRPGYHHAIVRALQMAVSIRIDQGLTSISGAASGDEAYKAGLLSFAFADMPALPPTVYQLIQQQTLDGMKAGTISPSGSGIQPTAPPANQNGNGGSRLQRLMAAQANQG